MGSLLFIIYINEPKVINLLMSLHCWNKSVYGQDINDTIEAIIGWIDRNNLKTNSQKTNVIFSSQRCVLPTFTIKYQETEIKEINPIRFFGSQSINNLTKKNILNK